MTNFMLRWVCDIGELLSQFNKPDFGSLPISITGIEVVAECFDLRLDLEEFIRCLLTTLFFRYFSFLN